MRILTGNGPILRSYINSLISNENVIIFPENSLDVHEQATFMSGVCRSFNGDIITLSPIILSDCQRENVFILDENGSLENPKVQTFGTSEDMIQLTILKKPHSISNIAFNKLELIREKVIKNELTKEETITELSKFGDSFEKMNIISILRKKELTL